MNENIHSYQEIFGFTTLYVMNIDVRRHRYISNILLLPVLRHMPKFFPIINKNDLIIVEIYAKTLNFSLSDHSQNFSCVRSK